MVRTFFDAIFTWTPDSYTGRAAPRRDAPFTRRSAPSVPASANNGTAGGRSPARSACTTPSSSSLASRWVKPSRQFSAPWANYPGNNFDGLVGGGGTITGVNQFIYTAQFGNGVSATFVGCRIRPQYYQAGNSQHRRGAGSTSASLGGAFGTSDYRRHACPGLRRHTLGRPGLGYVPGVGRRA